MMKNDDEEEEVVEDEEKIRQMILQFSHFQIPKRSTDIQRRTD